MEWTRKFVRQIMAGDHGLLLGLIAIAATEVISAAIAMTPARRSAVGREYTAEAQPHRFEAVKTTD